MYESDYTWIIKNHWSESKESLLRKSFQLNQNFSFYRKHVVRPMLLNGQFYGIDNKLAPIPQLSDPRNLGNKNK